MINILTNIRHQALRLVHLDKHSSIQQWRFIIHSIVIWGLIISTWIGSLGQHLRAVLIGIITISYIPFLVIELYHRPRITSRYRYGGITISALWIVGGFIDPYTMINGLWSIGFLTIGWRTWDYCTVIRRWKTWNIYNQVSTIGIFLISIVFALITMQRFQSINFSCTNINFLSTQFIEQFQKSDSVPSSLVTNIVVSSGKSNYLQLLDRWLITTSGDNSLSNTIKTQVRNSVIIVMDQKQLYDKSICDYVTKVLNDNYRKPSFFYSGILLLTFIGLAPARIALIIVASIFSLILRGLYRLGIYRSHTTLIQHEMLE